MIKSTNQVYFIEKTTSQVDLNNSKKSYCWKNNSKRHVSYEEYLRSTEEERLPLKKYDIIRTSSVCIRSKEELDYYANLGLHVSKEKVVKRTYIYIRTPEDISGAIQLISEDDYYTKISNE